MSINNLLQDVAPVWTNLNVNSIEAKTMNIDSVVVNDIQCNTIEIDTSANVGNGNITLSQAGNIDAVGTLTANTGIITPANVQCNNLTASGVILTSGMTASGTILCNNITANATANGIVGIVNMTQYALYTNTGSPQGPINMGIDVDVIFPLINVANGITTSDFITFTINKKGIYLFDTFINTDTFSTSDIFFYKSTVQVGGDTMTSTFKGIPVSMTLQMNAGDTFKMSLTSSTNGLNILNSRLNIVMLTDTF